MTGTHDPIPPGTVQLPCGCVVETKPGELGTCTKRCEGDPR